MPRPKNWQLCSGLESGWSVEDKEESVERGLKAYRPTVRYKNKVGCDYDDDEDEDDDDADDDDEKSVQTVGALQK